MLKFYYTNIAWKMTSFSCATALYLLASKIGKRNLWYTIVFMIHNESFKQHARINLSPCNSSWVWEWENWLRSECICHYSKKHKERLCGKTQRGICSTRRSNRNQFSQMMQIILGCVMCGCIHDAPKQALLVKGRRVKCDERETQECEWWAMTPPRRAHNKSFKCASNTCENHLQSLLFT